MFIIRTLLLGILALFAYGCSKSSDLSGTYATEVSQSSGKQTIVGDLELKSNGEYQAQIGQLTMSGTWKSGNGQLFLNGSDDTSKFLPNTYRVDGNRLIAQFEGVDAKHWRFVKTDSKPIANR